MIYFTKNIYLGRKFSARFDWQLTFSAGTLPAIYRETANDMKEAANRELFKHAISEIRLEIRPIFQEITNSTFNFFEEFQIPQELRELLIENSFDRPLKIGNVSYSVTNYIGEENLEEINLNCIKESLLIIGSGLNGDPIVVDLKTLSTGFLFHDELWEHDYVNVREIYVDTKLSVGQFFFNASKEIDTFPVDAYEAAEIFRNT